MLSSAPCSQGVYGQDLLFLLTNTDWVSQFCSSSLLCLPWTSRREGLRALSYDETFSYIRSFHASRRLEPISDGSERNFFLGCLILAGPFVGTFFFFKSCSPLESELSDKPCANCVWL